MKIQRHQSEEEGQYFIEENGEILAQMEFRLRQGRLIIVHTVVEKAYEGKGYGKMLVEKAVSDARAGKYAIVPVCKFARKYFDTHPEAGDVL